MVFLFYLLKERSGLEVFVEIASLSTEDIFYYV